MAKRFATGCRWQSHHFHFVFFGGVGFGPLGIVPVPRPGLEGRWLAERRVYR